MDNTYKGILFDLDNTLLLKKPSTPEMVFSLVRQQGTCVFSDVERAYAESEVWQGGQILEENRSGIRMSDEEYLDNLASFYKKYFPAGETLPELYAVLRGEYEWEYVLNEGAWELLEELREKGTRLGVVSNNRKSVRGVLSAFGIDRFFQTVVLSEEVNLYKPDPEILWMACRELDVLPADCLYVGDHPFDVLCAHSAKMDAAWLSANQYEGLPEFIDAPQYQLRSLGELREALNRRPAEMD